jgi:hypothetical protein
MVREPKISMVVPCGTANALYSESYEPKVHPDGHSEVIPLCASPQKRASLPGDFEIIEVVHVFQCVVTEKKVIEMQSPPSAGNAEDESPLRVSRGVVAGGDAFQIRGVAAIDTVVSWKERVVEATAYARPLATADGKLQTLSGVQLAEAEYGFDGTEPLADWMWTNQWTARLTRVRAPENASATAGFVAVCEAGAALFRGCRSAGVVLAGMAPQVFH